MVSYKEILKTTSLFGGVQGLNILLNIVRTWFVARLIGPEGVGLNSIYNEARELIHQTTNLGLDVSGIRGISALYEEWQNTSDEKTRQRLKEEIGTETAVLRSWVLLLALLGTLLCMICAMPLSLITFNDYDHTWGYVLLAPTIGFSTIACGEMAVLKGKRKLRDLATVSVLNVAAGLIVCIPIFYIWHIDGVLPAMLLLCLTITIITMVYSFKAEKPRYVFASDKLRKGNKMLSVGFNFVVCSIISHASLLAIQAFLNNHASLAMVGLYNSAYTLTMTYAGMVFAAMDTDYYPRLSGITNNIKERTATVLGQQNVTLILVTPLLAAMIVALPIIVPMLLSSEFNDIIPMAQITTVGLIFRAIYLPNSLISLAAGDNKTFLFINIVGSIDILLVIVGYEYAGLYGMGVALTIQNAIDMLLVLAISKMKYGVTFNARSIVTMFMSTLLLFMVYSACMTFTGWMYWVTGAILTMLCAYYSYTRYKKA